MTHLQMRIRHILVSISLFIAMSLQAQVFNREPLAGGDYAQLPLGAIKPLGWLKEQLQRQADGLTGHLDEVYPEVMGPSNAWLGGDGDAWERGPYWIDGLLPLAYILNDKALIDKAQKWVEAILASQTEDGYIGPAQDHPFVYGLQRGGTHDWWPKMVALKILHQYYSATGDGRVPQCMLKYYRYQMDHLGETPLDHWSDWGKWRGADNLDEVYWLYNITGEEWLLDLGRKIHAQATDWTSLFLKGDIFYRQGSVHCVNLGQGFKAPSVWWQYSRDERDLDAPLKAAETIRHTVGLPTGLWAGDEMLHWGSPTRGSELCTAVEMMYSLETILRISCEPLWADYLERVAYNALPTQYSDDFYSKQYFQQTNQVSCTRDQLAFSTPHDGTDVLFGTLNGYPCCLSNMHQGWPKFTQNLWYATRDGGLAAMVYAPCTVSTTIDGADVTIKEETSYPFGESIVFTVDYKTCLFKKVRFPLELRIPGWCGNPVLRINGETVDVDTDTQTLRLDRQWKKGDRVEVEFPMEVEIEQWYDKALTIVRGPLVYALKMNENRRWVAFEGIDRYYGPGAWEVTSDTPWNYCLVRDSLTPDKCRVVVSESISDYPWTLADAPVSIFVPARTLPGWTKPDSVAFWTEDGNDTGEDVVIELIPYGCTTLRIAEFPSRIVPWDLELRKERFLE